MRVGFAFKKTGDMGSRSRACKQGETVTSIDVTVTPRHDKRWRKQTDLRRNNFQFQL